jgi:hypothetical protein
MLIPVGVVKEATLEALLAGWGLNNDKVEELARRPLGEIASNVRGNIESQLVSGVFAIEPILRQILKRNEEHVHAIDALIGSKELQGSDVAIAHVRLIEESFTTAAFVISEPSRYEEFGWRWSNFVAIHGIRNRIFGLSKPLTEDMISWIKANEKQLAWIDPKGRLTADISTDKVKAQWEKCGNWLVPTTIKEVFEKTGRLDSYTRKGYDMGSQSVHLSPMGDIYMSYELDHHNYSTFMLESGNHFVIKMFAVVLDLVKNPVALRKVHALENLMQTYCLLSSNPARFSDLVKKEPVLCRIREHHYFKPQRDRCGHRISNRKTC